MKSEEITKLEDIMRENSDILSKSRIGNILNDDEDLEAAMRESIEMMN